MNKSKYQSCTIRRRKIISGQDFGNFGHSVLRNHSFVDQGAQYILCFTSAVFAGLSFSARAKGCHGVAWRGVARCGAPAWGFYSTPGCPTSLLCQALRALYITALDAPLYYLLSTVLLYFFSLHSYLVSLCSPSPDTILSRHSKKKPIIVLTYLYV